MIEGMVISVGWLCWLKNDELMIVVMVTSVVYGVEVGVIENLIQKSIAKHVGVYVILMNRSMSRIVELPVLVVMIRGLSW